MKKFIGNNTFGFSGRLEDVMYELCLYAKHKTVKRVIELEHYYSALRDKVVWKK